MNKVMVFIAMLFAVILFIGCGNKDFKTESNSGGVNIKEYTGSEENVIIPEKINGKMVYGISGYLTKDGEYVGAFENNQMIKSVIVPDNWMFTVYENAFRNCTSLETVKLPYSIDSIKEEAFKNCTSLVSIEIPEAPPDSYCSLYIHREAFANCIALEQVS
ncbi:MAG: leucine-rich repeat domain-containing protein, partial [Tannerellaceae bacterium]|nr:leucine-rich repeat domain-containing protein [Tannerellaceae bacterium]